MVNQTPHAKIIYMKGKNGEQGFALPTVVLASVLVLIALSTALTSLAGVRAAMDEQYYAQLSREAAEAGWVKAQACITRFGSAGWSDANPLTPQSDCAGAVPPGTCPSAACYVVNNGTVKTSFNIGTVTTGANNRMVYSVKSSIVLTKTSDPNSAWRTSSDSFNYLSLYADLPKLSGGAGWDVDNHIGFVATGNNQLYGYGANASGQINNAMSPTSVLTPVKMALPTNVSYVKKVQTSGQGAGYVCIIGPNSSTTKDEAYCRGQGFTLTATWTKVNVPAGMNVYDMSLNGYGPDSACFLAGASNMDMQAYCVGGNDYGLLGNGSTASVPMGSPTKFILPSGLTATGVEIQNVNACVIANTGDAYCAGRSDYGQVAGTVVALPGGISTPVRYRVPSTGGIPHKVKQILMQYHGDETSMAVLTTDGIIWVSGDKSGGMFGTGVGSGNTGTGPAEVWGNAVENGAAQFATGGTIRSLATGHANQCLDNSSGTLADQNPVSFWLCNTTNAQKWFYTEESQSIWLTLSGGGRGSDFCLDLPGGNIAPSQVVKIHTCNQSAAQRWVVIGQTIRPASNTGLCLAAPSGNASNGVAPLLWTCNGGAEQRWELSRRVFPWKGMIGGPYTLCGIREETMNPTSGVWCAGDNNYGQMANVGTSLGGGTHGGLCQNPSTFGTLNMNMAPGVRVDYQKLSKEWQYQYDSLMVIGTDGQVYGGGRNAYGKLGNDVLGDSLNSYRQCTTVKMQLPLGVTAMDMSTRDEYSTYILGSDGKVYATGRNNLGQLGDGSTTNRLKPVVVSLPNAGSAY